MSTFNQSLTRIRRFLRDPDGNIWTDDQIRYHWNDAQDEVATDTHILVKAETLAFPQGPAYSFTHNWEEEFTDSDTDLRVLSYGQAINLVYTYPWEFAYSGTSTPQDEGSYRWTHPFEGTMYTTAQPVPNILNANFVRGIWAAYDEEEITPITLNSLQGADRWYRTRKGEATYYYRDSDYANTVVIYPQPAPGGYGDPVMSTSTDSMYPNDTVNFTSEANIWDGDTDTYATATIVGGSTATIGSGDAWDEEPDFTSATLSVTIQRLAGSASTKCELTESDGTVVDTYWTSGSTAIAKTTYETDVTAYIGDLSDLLVKFTCTGNFWDSQVSRAYDVNISGTASVVSVEAGISVGDLTDSNYLDTDDRFVIIYEFAHDDIPSGSGNWDTDLDWPDWMVPYIEAATLERCYGADTDGFIPTLNEYWKLRKEVGVKILKTLQTLWLYDRKLAMGKSKRRRKPSGPSLGSHYPRIHT